MPEELLNDKLSPLLPANPDQPDALVVHEDVFKFVAKVLGASVYGLFKISVVPKS